MRHGESDQRQITYSDPNTELLPAVAGLSSGTVTAIAASSATAAIAAGIQSGKLGAAFQTGLIAAASAFAFAEVGAATDGDFNAKGFNAAGKSADDYFGTLQHFENIAGHAAVGCASGALSGGDCGSSAFAGAAGAFAGPKLISMGAAGGATAAAVIGGTASVIGGGKFENGAMTGAFGYLFNAWADSQKDVTATIEGTTAQSSKLGGTTAYGYNTNTDVFVALPDENLRGYDVLITVNGQSVIAPVGDIGPWNGGHTRSGANLNDQYWENNQRPQAETGTDLRGRTTNKAGIDISAALARQLGLKGNTKIEWRGLPPSPMRRD